jgi:hypothetical protein
MVGLVTFFVYLYPLKSYSTFFILLENPLCRQNSGVFLGILNPLAKYGETAIQKTNSLRQIASFEVSNVKIGRAVWSAGR